MYQTTLLDVIAPEAQVYEFIKDTLYTVVRDNFLPEQELSLQKCRGYYSVTYLSAVIARIHFGKKSSYISVDAKAAKPLLTLSTIEFSVKKSDMQLVRIKVNAPEDVLHILDIIAASAQSALDSIPKEFDCCSRYEACSDAMQCLQPDKQARLGCGYRRILATGRVFYGKNKNV